jgi:hypothetical protein
MSNGRITKAQIEAMLTGDRREIDRYLLTAVIEIRDAVEEIPGQITSTVAACRAEREAETSDAEAAARTEVVRRQLRTERRAIIAWTVGIVVPVLGLVIALVNLT